MALLEVGIDAGCYTLQDTEAEALLERLMRAYQAGNQNGIRKLGGALIRRMVERVDEEWENEERFSSEPDPYDVWADSQIELTRREDPSFEGPEVRTPLLPCRDRGAMQGG